MNKILNLSVLIILAFTFITCSNQQGNTLEKEIVQNNFPTELVKVFEQHGGLAQWQKMKAMSYEIVKEDQNEKQIVDLIDRRERIEAKDFTMGYDGLNFWLEADTTYKGNPKFYKNLMFYFYAMPFVIADDGIIYSETAPLEFEGKTFPGLKISYKSDIGVSPEDEYFVYYDPETFEMKWLGYTVTYFSQEKSKSIKWINYDQWKIVNGVKIPHVLAWYEVEENAPMALASKREISNITLSETRLADDTFVKTEAATIVTD